MSSGTERSLSLQSCSAEGENRLPEPAPAGRLFVLPEIDERAADFVKGAFHVFADLTKAPFDRAADRIVALILVIRRWPILVGRRDLVAAHEQTFGTGDGAVICPDENAAGGFSIWALERNQPDWISAVIGAQGIVGGREIDVRLLRGLLGESKGAAGIEVKFAGIDAFA